MQRGTRDFALPYDETGTLVLVRTAPAGRSCPVCGKQLSIYNRECGELCAQCDARAARPLSPKDIQALFEAVCGALAAPIVDDGEYPTRSRRKYISVGEAARELGISVRTMQEWCASGRLKTKPKRTPKAPYKIVPAELDREMRQRERS